MEHPKLKLKIPADFLDRFPDGDYTVGRGADPRGTPPAVQSKQSTAAPCTEAAE